MDILFHQGVEIIVAIQSLGDWLEGPMHFFTVIGAENFYYFLLPAIYWSFNRTLGLRAGLVILSSDVLGSILKIAFAFPRPYWVSSAVRSLEDAGSFGFPSGHAKDAAAIWGTISLYIGKTWFLILALMIIFLIGFSRMYLGVHFLYDVLGGWLFGGFTAWIFYRYWASVSAWLRTRTFTQQIWVGFAVSLMMTLLGMIVVHARRNFVLPELWRENALRAGASVDSISSNGIIASGGTFFGFAIGAARIFSHGGYEVSGSLGQRVLRYIVGMSTTIILWRGLGSMLPGGDPFAFLVADYFRNVLIGFWVSAGALWLFHRLNLAGQSPS